MSTETAGSGRPGEAEAIEAATVEWDAHVGFGDFEDAIRAAVAAAYPHIARAAQAELREAINTWRRQPAHVRMYGTDLLASIGESEVSDD